MASDPMGLALSMRLHTPTHVVNPDTTHFEPPRNVMWAISAFKRPQYTLAQIL